MTNPRDRYLIGKLATYDASTVARIDSHLRALRLRLVGTTRQVASARADVDALLERRTELSRVTTH